MANHSSAKKSYRKIQRRTHINKSRSNRIKTFIRNFLRSIKSNDSKDKILEMFKKVQSEIMKGVGKKVLKLNNASNKIRKIFNKVKKIT